MNTMQPLHPVLPGRPVWLEDWERVRTQGLLRYVIPDAFRFGAVIAAICSPVALAWGPSSAVVALVASPVLGMLVSLLMWEWHERKYTAATWRGFAVICTGRVQPGAAHRASSKTSSN